MELESGRPFVAFRMPHESVITLWSGVVDTDSSLDNKERFVFHPFREGEQTLSIIPISTHVLEIQNKRPVSVPGAVDFESISSSVTYEEYTTQVETILKHISSGEVNKVVLSRKLTASHSIQDLTIAFLLLHYSHPQTFVSWFYTPQSGHWIGATPELLLNQFKNQMTIQALAGTLRSANEWRAKERNEQELVQEFIQKNLLASNAQNIKAAELSEIRYGDLRHLSNYISAEIDYKSSLSVVPRLHPTPAVCGLPKDKAADIIDLIEPHHRAFYSGYLGRHQPAKERTTLYVNLRCMYVRENEIDFYVGGGIVDGSTAQKEWEETEAKFESMKRIFG